MQSETSNKRSPFSTRLPLRTLLACASQHYIMRTLAHICLRPLSLSHCVNYLFCHHLSADAILSVPARQMSVSTCLYTSLCYNLFFSYFSCPARRDPTVPAKARLHSSRFFAVFVTKSKKAQQQKTKNTSGQKRRFHTGILVSCQLV